MTIRVGINGFGRMGRLALRAAWGDPATTFVRINDPAGDAATVAHLLNFDLNDTHARIYAWYDSAWGHANRTAERVRLVGNADR